MTAALARFCSGRVHYAWVALVVAFTVTRARSVCGQRPA